MADKVTIIKTIDVQLLNANREQARTYKIDNPKNDISRLAITEAFAEALANEWLLARDGSIAAYIGETTVNYSQKTSLGGADFTITPATLNFTLQAAETKLLTIAGATIQGYNIKNFQSADTGDPDAETLEYHEVKIEITENAMQVKVTGRTGGISASYDLVIVAHGIETTIPVTFTA